MCPPPPSSRATLRALVWVLWLPVAGCLDAPANVEMTRLELEDPDGVVDDIAGDLQLLVMPGGNHVCLPAAGVLDPPPPIDGAIDGFIRDERFALDGSATVSVPPGDLALLIRGRDAAGTLVATGCEDVTLAAGETRTVGITVRRAVVTGFCGNGDVELGESCDDGDDPDRRLTDGDGCDALCQTEPFAPETDPASAAGAREQAPAAAWSPDGMLVAGWHVSFLGRNVRLRLYDPEGRYDELTSGLQVAVDAESRPGPQVRPALDTHAGRLVAAWTDLAEDAGDVRVQFYRVATLRGDAPDSKLATADAAGTQDEAEVAFDASGQALVVFEDSRSPTGIHGRAYTADGAPLTAAPIPLGTRPGATHPTVASTGSGWLVAFATADGDVRVQRVGSDGVTVEGPRDVAEGGGVQDQPALAAVLDGPALVVWRDDRETAAGDGTSIRGRFVDADGTPQGPERLLDTTAGVDRGTPTVAAGPAFFAVAWSHGDREIRGRFLDDEGTFLLSRERFPSSADFPVSRDGASLGRPAVAAGGAGQVVFLWESGDPTTVRGRFLAAP